MDTRAIRCQRTTWNQITVWWQFYGQLTAWLQRYEATIATNCTKRNYFRLKTKVVSETNQRFNLLSSLNILFLIKFSFVSSVKLNSSNKNTESLDRSRTQPRDVQHDLQYDELRERKIDVVSLFPQNLQSCSIIYFLSFDRIRSDCLTR